ncbi:MAG TPA: hypothetical protein VGN57_10370 [Pirellulaceae bacterium]|jgi:hypothetical protein|nr:hypothetical protein [Pirellulaceae bacterium]
MIPLNALIGTLASPARDSYAPMLERRTADLAAFLQRPATQEFVLLACCVVIGLVSAYDGYLTIRYHESLAQMELNPLGRTILQLAQDGGASAAALATFLGLKFAGTVIVICALQGIFRGHRRIGLTSAIAVATVQVLLGFYLTFGEHYMIASLLQ